MFSLCLARAAARRGAGACRRGAGAEQSAAPAGGSRPDLDPGGGAPRAPALRGGGAACGVPNWPEGPAPGAALSPLRHRTGAASLLLLRLRHRRGGHRRLHRRRRLRRHRLRHLRGGRRRLQLGVRCLRGLSQVPRHRPPQQMGDARRSSRDP